MTRREFERVCARLDFELPLDGKIAIKRTTLDGYYDFMQIAEARWAVTRESRGTLNGKRARRLFEANPWLRMVGEIAVRTIGAGHCRDR